MVEQSTTPALLTPTPPTVISSAPISIPLNLMYTSRLEQFAKIYHEKTREGNELICVPDHGGVCARGDGTLG